MSLTGTTILSRFPGAIKKIVYSKGAYFYIPGDKKSLFHWTPLHMPQFSLMDARVDLCSFLSLMGWPTVGDAQGIVEKD